jgi:hypothetical protein
MLLGLTNLPRRLGQVLLIDILPMKDQNGYTSPWSDDSPVISNGKHAGLGNNIAQIGSVEGVRKLQDS